MTNPTSPSLPLADIHLQSDPSIWPLAWGWWAIILITLGVLIALSVTLYRWKTARKPLQEAKVLLDDLDSIAAINTLLKRTCLTYFDHQTVAKLTGDAWLAFLDEQLPEPKRGFIKDKDLWQKGVFSSLPVTQEEMTRCKDLATTWLANAISPKVLKEASHV